jgi:hypothetical protein
MISTSTVNLRIVPEELGCLTGVFKDNFCKTLEITVNVWRITKLINKENTLMH